MTKKDLERRNKFLLLQLKIVNELVKDFFDMPDDERIQAIGTIKHYTTPENIKTNIKFIEDYNESYNFFNKLMDVKEYE